MFFDGRFYATVIFAIIVCFNLEFYSETKMLFQMLILKGVIRKFISEVFPWVYLASQIDF